MEKGKKPASLEAEKRSQLGLSIQTKFGGEPSKIQEQESQKQALIDKVVTKEKVTQKKYLEGLEELEEPPPEYLDELIGHAKLIQDVLEALGIMLNEIQDNLGLLPEESQKRILQAAGFAVEQSKQRKIKAEIQRILREDKRASKTSLNTSEEDGTIFPEITVTNTEVWTAPEDFILIIKHAMQH